MPHVPEVAGQPRPKSITQPPIETDPPIKVATKVEEVEPEPAIPVSDRPSQDDLAALSIQTQTVAKRNAMTPGAEKPSPYKFTDEDRKLASESHWTSRYPWDTADLDEALSYLAELRLETEKGGIALQKRISELKVERAKCFGCDNTIEISAGRWAGYRTRNNFETGIPEVAYACSAACMIKLNRDFAHPVRVPMPREG